MNHPAVIRPAIADDVEAILQVQVRSGLSPSSAETLHAAMLDPNRHVVVAERRGTVVGWAKTHYWEYDDGPAPAGHYLGGLTVSPEFRRTGLGLSLSAARLEWIWQRNAEAWYVTNARNVASIALHRRLGFEEAARAPRFHTTTFDGGTGILWRASRPQYAGRAGRSTQASPQPAPFRNWS